MMKGMFSRIDKNAAEEFSALFQSKWHTEVTDREVIVKLPCPGCKKEEIKVEAIGDFLTVRSRHHCRCCDGDDAGKEKKEKKEKKYLFKERSCAIHEESVRLPVEVDSSKASAKYIDGILEIVLPRKSAAPGSISMD